MQRDELLVEGEFRIEKFPGKGGWCYVALPGVSPDRAAHFGMVKVYGNIDTYVLENCNLMPMGKGGLFLPVRAEIRKKIGKTEGDQVSLRLFTRNFPHFSCEDLLLCMQDEPGALENFRSYTPKEQQAFTDWIILAKQDELRVERIAKTIDMLLRKQKIK